MSACSTTHHARYWLDRAIRQVETRPMPIVAYARAWYWITQAQITIGDVRVDSSAPLLG